MVAGAILEITNISCRAIGSSHPRRLTLKFHSSCNAIKDNTFSDVSHLTNGWTTVRLETVHANHVDPNKTNDASFLYIPASSADVDLQAVTTQQRLLLPLLSTPWAAPSNDHKNTNGAAAPLDKQQKYQFTVAVEKQQVDGNMLLVGDAVVHKKEVDLMFEDDGTLKPHKPYKHEFKAGKGTAVVTCTITIHSWRSLEALEAVHREVAYLLPMRSKDVYAKTWKAASIVSLMVEKYVKQLSADRTAPRPPSLETLVEQTSIVVNTLRVLQFQASASSKADWASKVKWVGTHFATACLGLHQQHYFSKFVLTSKQDLEKALREAADEWRNPRVARFRSRLAPTTHGAADTEATFDTKDKDVAERVRSEAKLKFVDGAKTVFSAMGSVVSSISSSDSSSSSASLTTTSSGGGGGGVVGEFIATLTDVTNVLGPLVQALPFGEALVNLLSTMYQCFTSRRELLEQSEKITTQLSMLLHVLLQPSVQKLIQSDAATNGVLEELFCCVDECSEIMEDYCKSNPVYQFFAASRVADDIDEHTKQIASYLDRLHHLVSLRTLAHLQENSVTVNAQLAGQAEMLMGASSSIEALITAVHQQGAGGASQTADIRNQLISHINGTEERIAGLVQQLSVSTQENAVEAWKRCSSKEIASIVHDATESVLTRHIEAVSAMESEKASTLNVVLKDVLDKINILTETSGADDSAANTATRAISDFRQYVTDDLIPSMLMACDGREVDQQAAIELLHENLLEKFSDECERKCRDMEARLNATAGTAQQETMGELHNILSNIRSAATSTASLAETLNSIREAVNSTEENLCSALEACVRKQIAEATSANKVLHEVTMKRFDSIEQSMQALGVSADQRADLLLGRVTACVEQTVKDALKALKEQQLSPQSSATPNKDFKAWADAQEALQGLQQSKLDSLNKQQEEVLGSLASLNLSQANFADALNGLCTALKTSATSMETLNASMKDLASFVKRTHDAMLKKFDEQKKVLSEIQSHSEVSASKIDALFNQIPETRKLLSTEFQDMRKDMLKNQGAANEDMKQLVCQHIDKMFQKLYLTDVTSEMLNQHLEAVKASCHVALDDAAIQRIGETVAGSLTMVVHDLQKGAATQLSEQLSVALSQCEIVVARATKAVSIEVVEQLANVTKTSTSDIASAITASEDNLSSLIRTISEAQESRISETLNAIQKDQREILLRVSRHPNDLRFQAQQDFDGIMKKKCTARCASFSVAALRSELRAAYCKKFQHFQSAVGTSVLHADVMFTTLRIVEVPAGVTQKEKDAADELHSSTFDSSEIVQAMKAFEKKILLVEGRAGIGKTSFAMQLCRLQNYYEGFTILITLSELAEYVVNKNPNLFATEGDGYRLSLRELMYLSLRDVSVGDKCFLDRSVIDLIFYSGAPIVWIVDGLDEVQLNKNPFVTTFLTTFTTIAGRQTHPMEKNRPSDLVLLTSREERSGNYCYDDIPVMSINPWTKVEVKEFANKFFQQDEVVAIVKKNDSGISIITQKEADDRIRVAMESLETTIFSGQLGPFATLPIITEMLCWQFANDPSPTSIATINAASLYNKSLRDLFQRDEKKKKVLTTNYETVEKMCIEYATTALTTGTLEFQLSLLDSAQKDLSSCGLVRCVSTANTTVTVRFGHKSIMEYFAARRVAEKIELLSEIRTMPFPTLPPPPRASNVDAARTVEFVTYAHNTDYVKVHVASDITSPVSLILECDTKEISLEVVWVPVAEEPKYLSDLKATFAHYSNKEPFSMSKWKPAQTTFNQTAPKGLKKGIYCFIVRSPEPKPLPILAKLQATQPVDLRRDISLTHQASFADILEDKQQRNFFCLVAMLANTTVAARQALTKFVTQRFDYHLIRTLPLFDKQELKSVEGEVSADRIVASRIVKSSSKTDGQRVDFLRKRCGIDLLVELSQLSDGIDYQTALGATTESSGFFGVLLEKMGFKSQSFWSWMIVPCARYGAVDMLKFVEGKLKDIVFELRRGPEYRKALVQAVMHRHDSVAKYLVNIPIELDLTVACQVGADDAVSQVLQLHPTLDKLLEAIKAALDARQFSVVQLVLRIGHEKHVVDPVKVTKLIVDHFLQHQHSAAAMMLRYSLVQIVRGSPEAVRLALLTTLSEVYDKITPDSWKELVADPTFRTEIGSAMRSHFGALLLGLRLNDLWITKIVSPEWMTDAKQTCHGPFISMLSTNTNPEGQNIAHVVLSQKSLHPFATALATLSLAFKSIQDLFKMTDMAGNSPLACAFKGTTSGSDFASIVSFTTTIAAKVGLAETHPKLVFHRAPAVSDLLTSVDEMLGVLPESKIPSLMTQLLPVLLSPFFSGNRSSHRLGSQHAEQIQKSILAKKVFQSTNVDKDLDTFLVALVISASLQVVIVPRGKVVAALKGFENPPSSAEGRAVLCAFDAILRPVFAPVQSKPAWESTFKAVGELVLPQLDDKIAEYLASSVLPELYRVPQLDVAIRNRMISSVVALGRPIIGVSFEGKTLSNTVLDGVAFRECDMRNASIEHSTTRSGSLQHCKIADLKFSDCDSRIPPTLVNAPSSSLQFLLHSSLLLKRSPTAIVAAQDGRLFAKRGQEWFCFSQTNTPGVIAPIISTAMLDVSQRLSIACIASVIDRKLRLDLVEHNAFTIVGTATFAEVTDVTNLHVAVAQGTSTNGQHTVHLIVQCGSQNPKVLIFEAAIIILPDWEPLSSHKISIPTPLQTVVKTSSITHCCGFAGSRLLFGGADGNVMITDKVSLKARSTVSVVSTQMIHADSITSISLLSTNNKDSWRVLSSSKDGTIQATTINSETGTLDKGLHFPLPTEKKHEITSACWAAGGAAIITSCELNGLLTVWDSKLSAASLPVELAQLRLHGKQSVLRSSLDGLLAFSCSGEGQGSMLVDASLFTIPLIQDHPKGATVLACGRASSNAHWVAMWTDGLVRFWDLTHLTEVHSTTVTVVKQAAQLRGFDIPFTNPPSLQFQFSQAGVLADRMGEYQIRPTKTHKAVELIRVSRTDSRVPFVRALIHQPGASFVASLNDGKPQTLPM